MYKPAFLAALIAAGAAWADAPLSVDSDGEVISMITWSPTSEFYFVDSDGEVVAVANIGFVADTGSLPDGVIRVLSVEDSAGQGGGGALDVGSTLETADGSFRVVNSADGLALEDLATGDLIPVSLRAGPDAAETVNPQVFSLK